MPEEKGEHFFCNGSLANAVNVKSESNNCAYFRRRTLVSFSSFFLFFSFYRHFSFHSTEFLSIPIFRRFHETKNLVLDFSCVEFTMICVHKKTSLNFSLSCSQDIVPKGTQKREQDQIQIWIISAWWFFISPLLQLFYRVSRMRNILLIHHFTTGIPSFLNSNGIRFLVSFIFLLYRNASSFQNVSFTQIFDSFNGIRIRRVNGIHGLYTTTQRKGCHITFICSVYIFLTR